MNSHRELIVWQMAVELVNDACDSAKEFPSAGKFGVVYQLRRSAGSIPYKICLIQNYLSQNNYISKLDKSIEVEKKLNTLKKRLTNL